jgi:hypothetical protein
MLAASNQIEGVFMPTDMIREMYKVLPARCWALLAQTSRIYYKIFRDLLDKPFYLRNAYTQQTLLARIFKETDAGTMTVQAELSFGKTTLGYLAAGPFSVICAPSSVLKTWKDQGGPKHIGCIHKDPRLSKYLVYSGNSTKQDEYIKGLLSKKIEPTDSHRKFLVIICKEIHLSIVARLVSRLASDAGAPFTIVVDEAHKKHASIAGNIRADKILYMSAMQMGEGDINYSMQVERPRPAVLWNVRIVQPAEKFADAIKDVAATIEHTGQLKIVISSTEPMLVRLGILQKIKGGFCSDWMQYKVFRLVDSCNRITAFETHPGPAILYINSVNNEGLNINADVLFMLDPASINVNRCIQTAGRIQRTSSTRAAVNVVLFGSPEETLRLKYTVIMAQATTGKTPWPFFYDTLPSPVWLHKAFTLMRILCGDIDTADIADAAVCLAASPGNEDEHVSWWESRKGPESVLTAAQVRLLAKRFFSED